MMIDTLPALPWTSIGSSIHVRLRERPRPCRHEGNVVDHRRSTSPSPDQLRFCLTVQIYLQSSSSSPNSTAVLGYYTMHKFLVPPEEFVSEQCCGETVTKFIDLMNIPFSLDDNLYWTGFYEKGGVIECKSLENSQDLIRELAAGIRRIRSDGSAPSQDIILFIREFATLPEHEFEEWKCFSENHRLEHRSLVHWEPELRMHWRMAALRVLEKVRVEKGGGDVAEWAAEPCSICLEELVKGDVSEFIRLPCSHAYHEACILTWIKNHQACPYCRAKSPDIKIDYDQLRRNNPFLPYLNPNWEMCSQVLEVLERLRNHVGL
ncbi:E3 ubiquitin-protein ligase Iruka [Sesamum alatum]|uniref:E3 ubiquitin-protein ligase Iruka n=1 Tax=Sesamum alatum TaxID=300844 RepID=A0AAE1Z2L8_9LAMI|nr:E3 ubiquitin-protein ligase Iruka [Sesamum alatum]